MAISQEIWDKARTLFESGKLSLSEISTRTGIDKSTISKKAKIQQWSSVENSDYIDAKITIANKKSTLPMEKINILDDIANDILRRKNLVFGIQEKAVKKAGDMLDQIDTPQDLKFIVDAIDKAATTLGVVDRFAPKMEIKQELNNQNNNLEVKFID